MKFSKRSGCLSLVFIVIVAMYATVQLQFKAPSASDMHQYFVQHQEVFETTNSLILSAVHSGKTFVPNDSKSSRPFRWFEVVGDTVDEDFQVRYYTHLKGIGVKSFGTGIAYLHTPPETIYRDFDAMPKYTSREGGISGYCSIKGSWYIFFWRSH